MRRLSRNLDDQRQGGWTLSSPMMAYDDASSCSDRAPRGPEMAMYPKDKISTLSKNQGATLLQT